MISTPGKTSSSWGKDSFERSVIMRYSIDKHETEASLFIYD